MTPINFVALAFVLLGNIGCQFSGGSLSWKMQDGDKTKIQLTYRRVENSTSLPGCLFNSTTRSTKSTSPQNVAFKTFSTEDFRVVTNLTLAGDRFDCVDVSRSDNWSSHIYSNLEFIYKNGEEFYIGPASDEMFAKVNLKTRPLSNTINSSPVASVVPLITLVSGETYIAKIAVVDADFDHIKCRFANTTEEGKSFNTFPTASQSIDQQSCSVTINTTGISSGTYGVAVMIEDYEAVNSNSALSSVPVQFQIMVNSTADATSCRNISFLTEMQALDGTCIFMTTETMSVELTATAGCDSDRIERFATNSPIGTLMSDVTAASGNTYKSIISFNKTEWQETENPFCFAALSSNNGFSNTSCWIVVDANKSTSVGFEALFPGPSTLHPLAFNTITMLFHGIFTTLPTKIKTFRIYDESSDTLVKSVNISTECTECSVLSDNRLQIRIPTPLPWERGKTYYMQFDKGIAKSPSGCIESVGLSDKTSWTFVTNQFVTNSNVRIDMTLYATIDYQSQLPSPYKFTLGDVLYVDLKMVGEVDSLSIIPQNCYVTRTSDSESTDRYYLLKDRCRVDNTYREYSAPTKTYRFGFETLRFVGDRDETYLFCGVYICTSGSIEPACKVDCSSGQNRKRRSVVGVNYGVEYQLQTGPIHLMRKQDLQQISLSGINPYKEQKHQHLIVYNNSQSNTQTFIIVFVAAICAIMTCYVMKLFFTNIIVIETAKFKQQTDGRSSTATVNKNSTTIVDVRKMY